MGSDGNVLGPNDRRIDISEEVRILCEKFGVAVNKTEQITILPCSASVIVLKTNPHGNAYTENGDVAREKLHFAVTT